MKQRTFTDTYIRNLKLPGVQKGTKAGTPYKRAESGRKGEGRLIVRVLPNGVKEFFYRDRSNGEDKTVSLGRFDPKGQGGGKSLKQVNRELDKMRGIQEEHGDVKAHLEAQQQLEDVEKRKGTFAQLLEHYAAALEKAGKPSHTQARGVFRRHVLKPFPLMAKERAGEIGPEDIKQILARMVGRGITRQVNVARSYLKAAFTYGGGADYDAETAANDGVVFGLSTNPVLTKRIRRFDRTSERVLSAAELQAYWSGLEALPLVQRATLRFNLAMCAQRPTQLLRADKGAFDWHLNVEHYEGPALLLRDSKGRGGSRDHLLPLPTFALEQLKPLRELNGEADYLFSADGKKPMVVETLSKAVSEVAKGEFDQRDIRRTVETTLQKLGIDREVRAHLLSHGRTKGVQGQHYERYDFLPEKRQALERWAAHLRRVIAGEPAAKVTALRA